MVLLSVITQSVDKTEFDVDSDMTVGETKLLLKEVLGIPEEDEIKLVFRGETLLDGAEWGPLLPKPGEKLFLSRPTAASRGRTSGVTIQPGMIPDRKEKSREGASRWAAMEPMVNMMVQDPNFFNMMLNSSPELKQMVKDHPEVEQELRNPEMIKRMMQAQFDPEVERSMDTSLNMQMAQINAMPGGAAMLERAFNGMHDRMLPHSASTSADGAQATEEHAQPTPGQSANTQPLTNPWQSTPQNTTASMPPMGAPYPGFSGGATPPFPFFPYGGAPQPPMPQPQFTPQTSSVSPQVRYAQQLNFLKEMGFEDEKLCIEALERTNGDIDAAAEYIMSKLEEG